MTALQLTGYRSFQSTLGIFGHRTSGAPRSPRRLAGSGGPGTSGGAAGNSVSSRNKKRERQLAAAREYARREAARASASPLSREQILTLIEYISEEVVTRGRGWTSFDLTKEWVRREGIDEAELLAFLRSQRIKDDYSVLISADPNALFGATSTRLARMPLERPELEALLDAIDSSVRDRGCDHTTRTAQDWLSSRGLPVASALTALLARGGGCDCEIVLNVDPEEIYPS